MNNGDIYHWCDVGCHFNKNGVSRLKDYINIVNKDKNGDIGLISWSRIIEDELFVENFKSLVKSKKCLN